MNIGEFVVFYKQNSTVKLSGSSARLFDSTNKNKSGLKFEWNERLNPIVKQNLACHTRIAVVKKIKFFICAPQIEVKAYSTTDVFTTSSAVFRYKYAIRACGDN